MQRAVWRLSYFAARKPLAESKLKRLRENGSKHIFITSFIIGKKLISHIILQGFTIATLQSQRNLFYKLTFCTSSTFTIYPTKIHPSLCSSSSCHHFHETITAMNRYRTAVQCGTNATEKNRDKNERSLRVSILIYTRLITHQIAANCRESCCTLPTSNRLPFERRSAIFSCHLTLYCYHFCYSLNKDTVINNCKILFFLSDSPIIFFQVLFYT